VDSASCAAAGWNRTAAEAIQRWYSRALSSSQGTAWIWPESNSAIRHSISARQTSSAPSSDSASDRAASPPQTARTPISPCVDPTIPVVRALSL
jgi:hypothetical protein